MKFLYDRLRDVLESKSSGLHVAGAVVGVSVGGERIALAYGSANLNTGQAFTPDTGFLLGSVTKILVTTALLRLVDRGAVDLTAPVARYVPEFTLHDTEAARQINVSMLLNHTNGIDADALGPSAVRGRDSSKSYTEHLSRLDVLFTPGTFVHYSNPGFVLAARIIEEQTGLAFEEAIEQELFKPCGMSESISVPTQALLRRTAVGAFADPDTGELRPPSIFMLGESLAGAGSTLIVTVADMLTFACMHLQNGTASSGEKVLSEDLVAAMRTPTFETGLPQAPPVGLGWWMFPIAGTTALWHGGGSPGGSSSFCILPEYNAAIMSFVSGGGRGELNDLLHNAVIEELTSNSVALPFPLAPTPPGPDVVGQYASFQHLVAVEKDGDSLILTVEFEPYDEDHARTSRAYDGDMKPRPVTYTSVAPGQFARAGTETREMGGFFGRIHLLATLPESDGHRAGLHNILRYVPKVR